MTAIDFTKLSIAELAALVNQKFIEHKIKSVLVGGACVTIYSNNRYLSYDLDFVTAEIGEKVKNALAELGFERKGKYFARPDCLYVVEFVSPPVAVGEQLIQKFKTLRTPFGQITLLTPTDCIKDRLASFFHWNDTQSLEQAILVLQDQKIDLEEIKRWAKAENCLDKLKKFMKIAKKFQK